MKSHRKPSLGALSRRHFLKTTTVAAGAVAFGVPTLLRAQNLNSKLNIATVGLGKGASDTDHSNAENIVALCDIAVDRAGRMREKYPGAKFYQDYRKMLDEMGSGIDAVNVSTPDHMHAIVASLMMKHGKHVYCQKPLTQTIYEARYLRNLAASTGVVTQRGNQGSSADGLRRAVEVIQAGIIGQVHEVHIWTNRPIWPQGMNRPEGSDPVPASLDWDIWLGPAPMRPYKREVYEPFVWRGWQDFGTGALGDMACHTVNMAFRSLNLGYPTEIEAVALGGINKESYPVGSKIRFEFPARKTSFAAAHKTFFHRHDVPHLMGEVPPSACLLVGDKGKIFSPDDYGEQFFIKLNDEKKLVHYKKHPGLDSIPQTIPRNEFKGDADHKHHQEFLAAIKSGKPETCYSRFAVAAQLTEIMLLGCVALRAGQKIEWDGPNMVAKNCKDIAAPYIKRENRSGWALA